PRSGFPTKRRPVDPGCRRPGSCDGSVTTKLPASSRARGSRTPASRQGESARKRKSPASESTNPGASPRMLPASPAGTARPPRPGRRGREEFPGASELAVAFPGKRRSGGPAEDVVKQQQLRRRARMVEEELALRRAGPQGVVDGGESAPRPPRPISHAQEPP